VTLLHVLLVFTYIHDHPAIPIPFQGTMSETKKELQSESNSPDNEIVVVDDNGATVNASGWKDELDRQYGLLSLCGIALTVDNAWVALGSSISVSIGWFL
jgi:hypothetical protein